MKSTSTDSLRLEDLSTERERHYRELLALSRVSAALSGLGDLDTILKVALVNVLDIIKGTMGGILLLDERTQVLTFRAYQGRAWDSVKGLRFRLGEGIIGQVAQSGQPILLEDISTDPRVVYPAIVVAERLKASVAIPLRARDKILGVLNVVSRTTRSFTNSDLHLLCSIGDQLGVAIEQAKLMERLRKSRERLRKLARQNLVVEEAERKRIARELHDETSQTLSGLALQLQALIVTSEMSGNGSPEFVTSLKKIQTLTLQVHTEINRLIADLRPALLDTLGLVPAIRQHAESRLHYLGINVSVETEGIVKRLPGEVEAGLFRFVQGAVGNIAKHAEAKNATVLLEYRADEFYIKISDDGKGFDVSQITDVEESGRGRGLFSMRERIGFLGGISGIESPTGKGTTVWARVPLIKE